MESNSQIQLRTSSNNLPSANTPEEIAEIRLNERRFPRYYNIPQSARLEWVAGQVKYLASISRIRDFDGKEAILTATAFDEMVMKNEAISGLTMPEMSEAFKGGVFGLYGEFYGLSAPNLYGFARAFLESEKKQAATAIVRKRFAERKEAERNAEQMRIRAEIEEAKRNGSFVPTGRAWFTPKSVDDAIDDSAHREMVRRQAI